MRLGPGSHAAATAETCLRMLLRQIVKYRPGLCQNPAIILSKGWYCTGRIYREQLSGAILNPDCLIRLAYPFQNDMRRKRARTQGIVKCRHDFASTFLLTIISVSRGRNSAQEIRCQRRTAECLTPGEFELTALKAEATSAPKSSIDRLMATVSNTADVI